MKTTANQALALYLIFVLWTLAIIFDPQADIAIICYSLLAHILILWRSKLRLRYNRARKLKRNGGSHTAQQWKELKLTYGNRCASCGNSGRLTKDHILPVSKGGTDYISNIQPLCASCNASKGTKTIVY